VALKPRDFSHTQKLSSLEMIEGMTYQAHPLQD